ncbi:MAG: hypothetical protein AB8H03_12975 [Saprospiraceae bacterium]
MKNKFFKKIDTYLIENHPAIWLTKIHDYLKIENLAGLIILMVVTWFIPILMNAFALDLNYGHIPFAYIVFFGLLSFVLGSIILSQVRIERLKIGNSNPLPTYKIEFKFLMLQILKMILVLLIPILLLTKSIKNQLIQNVDNYQYLILNSKKIDDGYLIYNNKKQDFPSSEIDKYNLDNSLYYLKLYKEDVFLRYKEMSEKEMKERKEIYLKALSKFPEFKNDEIREFSNNINSFSEDYSYFHLFGINHIWAAFSIFIFVFYLIFRLQELPYNSDSDFYAWLAILAFVIVILILIFIPSYFLFIISLITFITFILGYISNSFGKKRRILFLLSYSSIPLVVPCLFLIYGYFIGSELNYIWISLNFIFCIGAFLLFNPIYNYFFSAPVQK